MLIYYFLISGVKREADAPDTSYYQWVTFVLLIQAGFFLVPFKVFLNDKQSMAIKNHFIIFIAENEDRFKYNLYYGKCWYIGTDRAFRPEFGKSETPHPKKNQNAPQIFKFIIVII